MFQEKKSVQDIEIMSPVGSMESLMAAIQGGAGSVYFGIGKLNMRARSSKNFTLDELKEITGICKKHGIQSYLTLNTVVYDEEIAEMHQLIDAAKKHGVSAVIASDLSVISYARSAGMEIHSQRKPISQTLKPLNFMLSLPMSWSLPGNFHWIRLKPSLRALKRKILPGPGVKKC